ncbi:MAG TPA: hypothetical protein VLJ39_09705, partial [Tepidisphaeraceae bacterium]|nr:hypothetical protein [Tepidisphaeraceae bacterium]
YGYIQGAEWMSSDLRKLHRLNRDIIGALPDADSFPYLTRSMFAIPGEEAPQGTYRSQIIHFAASMKEVEGDWKKWLEKFEGLLHKLYWFNAVVHLRAEVMGDHDYEWTIDANQIVNYLKDAPKPPTKWFFDGGPRSFDLSNYP